MTILFLTIQHITNISNRSIYTDLMRRFRNEGHSVYIVFPRERRYKLGTSFTVQDGVHLLGVKTLNIQKTNVIEKGIGTILLEGQFKRVIQKYLNKVSFDLILYSTPPITFTNVVKDMKRRNPQAISYLLLKDIFPQNAVDMGMLSKNSLLYRYFRCKEMALYRHSNFIGCMSPANVNFVLKHNAFISPCRVEVAPNSIELVERGEKVDRKQIRQKYNLPVDKPIFIYGGNLGKPQGVNFLIECLNANSGRTDCHFLVVGNGTEYAKLESWYCQEKPQNVSLFARLPKADYDCLVQSCDVGLIFLDYRFTIPNYPSRLLSYLEYKIPIIAATDLSTDIGRIAEENGYGYSCESNSIIQFTACVNKFLQYPNTIRTMGEKGYAFLLQNYLVEHTYKKIIVHVIKK